MYKTEDGAAYINRIHDAEGILNCIGMLICPDLFSVGAKAIEKLKCGENPQIQHENVQLWPSFFSGIEVISNRITPMHRDQQAATQMYDFLVSGGNHINTWFELPDVGARLLYNPGTVTAICGKVLRHGVSTWDEKTDRLCIAHFMRDSVHNRLNLPRPGWVSEKCYLKMMDVGFLRRHNRSMDNYF
jgi:hypothetical protein